MVTDLNQTMKKPVNEAYYHIANRKPATSPHIRIFAMCSFLIPTWFKSKSRKIVFALQNIPTAFTYAWIGYVNLFSL